MKSFSDLQSWLLCEAQRQAFLQEVRSCMAPEHYSRLCRLLELLLELLRLLELKSTSINRLRQLVFGARTESASNLRGGSRSNKRREGCPRGHGRRGHRSYTGARRVPVKHPSLKAGQVCPNCKKGTLRFQKQPATAVHVSGQPPVGAVIHEMERLRCDTCGMVFTAPTPAEAGTEKFDPTVGVLVGLLRYGSGMPFHRLERLQESVGVPLPASVQWEQVLRTALALEPAANHLLYLGAQCAVFYNDDTPMRIAAVRKQIEAETDPERTGIFTTGIVCEGTALAPPIRLVFTGRRHAGENLARVLGKRESGLAMPLHMCDALDRNHPPGHATELCNCLVHARRQFIEIRAAFPAECHQVVETFAVVYMVDAQCRKEGLDPVERLRRHQAQSQPVMEKLRQEFETAMAEKRVEPNSGLGDAIDYLLSRWETLTRFLTTPGAPLDNNVTERLLKSSILHRKNSMHYRTQRGADVGDRFMTVIETCRANGANPFDYMLAVVRNQDAVKADPASWMPWNYKQALIQAAAPRAP